MKSSPAVCNNTTSFRSSPSDIAEWYFCRLLLENLSQGAPDTALNHAIPERRGNSPTRASSCCVHTQWPPPREIVLNLKALLACSSMGTDAPVGSLGSATSTGPHPVTPPSLAVRYALWRSCLAGAECRSISDHCSHAELVVVVGSGLSIPRPHMRSSMNKL